MAEERIVKVPMQVELIRRMDRALSEARGGFTTRADFIAEAVEQLLVEISYEQAPPEPVATRASGATASADRPPPVSPDGTASGTSHSSLLDGKGVLEGLPAWEQSTMRLGDLAGTALRLEARGTVAEDGIASIEDEPLLGLHNRDYPSLWAAHRLAVYTRENLVPWPEFLSRVTAEAWQFAGGLHELERVGRGRRLTALFPANRNKWQSAERGFQSFAVGTVPRRADGGKIAVSGPLFAWRMCQLQPARDALCVGLTREGWNLLEALDGLSLAMPHDPELARPFFAHLRRHAPADWWGFGHVVRVVAGRPDREALVAAFAATRPEWTQAMASSFAQGYVARGREWGLIESKQVDGRYWLTDFGRRQLEVVAA